MIALCNQHNNYSFFVFKEHGHLFHKEKLICKSEEYEENAEIEQGNQIEGGTSIPLEPITNTPTEQPAAEEAAQNLGETSRQIPAEEEITASVQQDDYSR